MVLNPFLNILELIYEDVIRLFYANMTIIDVDDPVIQSFILGTHIKFNLERLCEILQLHNEGDRYYLTTYDDLSAYFIS